MIFSGMFLLAMLCATGIALGDLRLTAAAGLAPLLACIFHYMLKFPHVAILAITASHMLDLHINFYGLTLNIILVGICLFSIIVNKIDFRIVVDITFMTFLAIYIAMIVISYAITNESINFYDLNLYANNFLLMILMSLFNSFEKIESFYKTVLWCSLFLVCTGFYQIMTNGIPDGGMSGYWPNHVRYALHIALGIPFCFYFFKYYRNKHYGLLLLIFIAGVFAAFSRGVLLAFLMAAISGYLLYKYSSLSFQKKLLFIGICCLMLIMTAAMTANIRVDFNKYDPAGLKDITSGRSVLYSSAWEMFKENPILGVGWDQYKGTWFDYIDFKRNLMSKKELNPHSSYLKVLAELGLVGFTIYVLFNFFLWRAAGKTALTDLGFPLLIVFLIYYFHGFVDNNSYGNDRMFYLAAGVLFSIKKLQMNSAHDNKNNELSIS
jgi:O-antigen ligase